MKMIHAVLKECGFFEASAFSFTYQRGHAMCEHQVIPLISQSVSHEGYLVVPVSGPELPHLLDSDFMSSLTREMGRQEFYSPEMDRDTTLLLTCQCGEEEKIDHNAKVQIEDDPYYFKKYVFVYTQREETAAQAYINGRQGSLLEIIRTCLLDTDRFVEYKDHAVEGRIIAANGEKKAARGREKTAGEAKNVTENKKQTDEHLAYGFFLELATKVAVLPIRPGSAMAIRSVEEFWQEELRKTPVTNLDAVESVLKLDPDTADDVLARWNDLNRIDRK